MSQQRQPKVVEWKAGAPKMSAAPGNSIPELPIRLFIDRKSLRISAAAMIVVMTIYPTLSFAQSVPAGVTQIIPDGRTATVVTANGNVSTVTTGTVSGPNAFNSFSRFSLGAGNTGNLILPNGTSNLINLVNGNGPTTINGVLNAYKNGQIGGNVYFADPNGFVVGRSGVVNVGSLNVSTPTREFMDSVIGAGGQINQGAVNNLLAGTVPISPDGNIRIRGRINAADAVRLTGQNVFVGGGRDGANRDHAVKFASTVNSKGLRSANGIVVRNGSIQIVAADKATVSGRLTARSRTSTPGDIVVTAGGAMRIAPTAKLNAASKNGDAGNIILRAGGDLTVQTGASIDASSATGNAGLVELSSNGTFNFGSGVKINLGAPNGTAGMLLIDPTVVVIGDAALDSGVTLANDTVVNMIGALSAGGTFSVSATGVGSSITLAEHALIDTRRLDGLGHSLGNAYNVELISPTINIVSGARILAQAVNFNGSNYSSGNVALTAAISDHQGQLPSSATTSITIAGTITGGAISATSNSDASTVFMNSALGMAQFGAGVVFGALTGLNGGYVKSEASAKVTVEGTANINATGALTLASIGSEVAQDPVITFSLATLQNAVAAGVVVGIVNADIATHVKSGATISAGNLNVVAANNADLAVTSLVFTSTTAADGSLAYSTGTLNTKALVDPGVIINKVGNVTVTAQSQNSFSTSATALAGGTGSAAVGIAISDIHSNTVANLGANLAPSAGAGAVTVYSGSNTKINAVTASSTVGSPYLIRTITQGLSGASTSFASIFQPGGFFDSTRLFSATQQQGTTASLRVGLTLAINESSLTSAASIAALAPNGNGDMVASGTAPAIVASGGVGVISKLIDAGIRGDASASIESNPVGTAADPTTEKGISMAVNVTQITQSSNAFIGSNVSITAPHIGVQAESTSPITNAWLDFDSFSDVTKHVNGSLGVAGTILTTYANATAESASVGVAGAVNYFNLETNTTAWVGSGATLTQTTSNCTGSTTCWTSVPDLTLPVLPHNLDWYGTPTTVAWAHDVDVQATTTNSSINVGGNFSWITFFGTNSSAADATAVGGSANVNIFNTHTVAGIGAGVTVNAIGTVAVNAATSDLIYAVSPTSGKGSGMGLNGVASVLQLDNTTSASISNSAKVTASNVVVTAQQDISSFDVAGGVGASKATGVGIVVALAQMSANTSAYIGDNSSALAATGASIDDSNVAPSGAGWVSAFNTNVSALSVGRLTTVAVAAQYANNAPSPTDPPAFISTKPSNADYLATIAAFFVDGGISLLLKVTHAYNSISAVSDPVQGGNVTAGSGSAAVNLTSIATSASIAGATIKYTPGGNNKVSVQALNNTIVDTASGAAALSKGAPGTDYAVGLAGAVAVTMSTDMTTANINHSTVTAHDTTVQALAGGESTTLGLAVALTAGSGNGRQVSASVSVAQIDDGVQAGVDSSTIGQANGGFAGALSIVADQKTNIGIGAGSLYGGFGSGSNNGLGVSMTYAEIGDPSSGAAVSAVLSNSKVENTASLNVQALDNSRIISAAAVAGGGTNASGFAGSVVVNDIGPTILAEITGLPANSNSATVTGGITVVGDVTVSATGGTNATLDAIIANAAIAANGGLTGPTSNSGVDFSGAALSPNSTTGAAILAVAGNAQIGSSNVGVSIVVNRIRTQHDALIDRASVTSTGGVVSVLARDDAEIIGVAVGIGGATGAVAGNGSVAYNAINNAVIAQIGHGTNAADPLNTAAATVDAAAVSVVAIDSAKIRGAAGAISINASGGEAIGLSASINQIGTYVSAAIAGGHVSADNTLSDNSPLITGSLQAGSILVSGSSSADIISVAVGVAITVGDSQSSPPTPQANLASLVASLAPAVATQLTGYGGGGVTPPTPPPPPPPTPAPPATGMSGAGSFALNTELTTVYSSIDKGGNGYNGLIAANDNVLVLANNVDSIAAYGGALSVASDAGKGIGASVVVNTIGGTTSAGIGNSSVDARGTGSAATIDSGALANAVDPTAAVLPASDPNLSNGTTTIKGIAVVATSRQTANTVAAVLSASNADTALSANVITNVMGGSTLAAIKSSTLNTHLTSGDVSAVQVTASSASFANNLDLGIADSAEGHAGTIVLVINTMNRTTTASVDSTNIGSSTVSAGKVGVLANAFQGTAGEAIGAAGSGQGNALAGSALTNLFSSTTSASFDHGTVYATGMSVAANGLNGYFAAIGGAAAAASTGIGATVLVAISNNTSRAIVGDADPNSAATALHLTGPLVIQATNETDMKAYVIVGAIGGSNGVAAQFAGIFLSNTTDAELINSTVTNTAPANNGAVNLAAQETDSLSTVVGGLSAGVAAGVGAAVNLVMFKSNTKALMAGDTVTTAGAVTVGAWSTRDVNPITVTAALSGGDSFAGTVGVVLIGSGASSDQMSVLNAGATDGNSNSGTLGNAGASTGTNVLSQVGGGIDGVSAQILGGSVTAGSIDVSATSQMAVRNIVGALAIGLGSAGFGAGIGFTEVDQRVTAEASGGSLTSRSISIAAAAGDHGSGRAAQTLGAAGAGGFYVGLGAAVGYSRINNNVHAILGSTTDGGANGPSLATLSVSAADTSSIASYAYGFALGEAAIGISIANAEKSSSVTAEISSSTAVTHFASAAVLAGASGSVRTETIAGAGGVLGGAGASSTSKDTETVLAQIGNNASVSAAGAGVLVYATGTPELYATSVGVGVGGIGIGVSTSTSSAKMNITADVGDSTTFTGGVLTVSAASLVPANSHSAYAFAVAGGGGALYGLQGSYAQAANDSTVSAYGGTGVTLPSANVTIAAENDTDQYAKATGIAVGYVGAGATISEVFTTGHTAAYLGAGAITAAANTGSLSITAIGNDTSAADALAGSGGVYAGAAAVANITATSTLSAKLLGNNTTDTLYFGSLGVFAEHTTNYKSNGDAFQASAIGASGGNANNDITSSVTAEVGTNLIINTAGRDISVIASDIVIQNGGGARAGSGGIAAGAATLSYSTVRQTVNTNIDSGTIFSVNDDPSTSLAKINIEGYVTLQTSDSVSLNAGGLFAGGGAISTMDATATVNVNINATELFSAGNIDIGSAVRMLADNHANANLYGLITGAGARTAATLHASQNVTVSGTRIEGWGLINIYAGQSGDGSRYSSVSANATTIVYNQALIPISAAYSGRADAYVDSTLTLGSGSLVIGANNIFLGATPGSVTASGKGTNYNPYLSLFSTENHDDHSDTHGNGTGSVVANGTVMAGIHNQAVITIGLNGAISLDQANSPYGLTLEQVSSPSLFNPVMRYNSQKIQYSIVGGFNPHAEVVAQLASLSGLTTAQVEAELAGSNPTITVANDPTGDIQRQVNTLIQQAPFAPNGSGDSYVFGNILVSAGNVSILAKTLSGTAGSITARDSVSINIDNQGLKFLDLGKLTVSSVLGGHLNFTGNATDATSSGITYHSDLTGASPAIRVSASYNRKDPNTGQGVDQNGQPLVTTPDIYFSDVVSNLNGLFSITNQLGNVVATQSFNALNVEMNVPNGAFTFNGGAGTIYNMRGDVAAQWAGVQYRPTDTLTAVEAAATWLGTYGNAYLGGNGSYHPHDYYFSNSGTAFVYAPVSGAGGGSAIFTARLLSLGYANGSQWSAIFLPMGENMPSAATLAQTEGTSVANVQLSGWRRGWYENQAYGDGGHGGPFNYACDCNYFQVVQMQDQAVTPVTANSGGTAPTGVMNIGKAIILSAGVININGAVQVGQSSNFSANIGTNAQNAINNVVNDPTLLANARTAAAAGNFIDLSGYVTANGGDVKVGARYNAITNQVMLNSVVQGTGGYVYLNGKIISTSTTGSSQGNIIVNGGAGTVNINNQTGYALLTNTINTGVSAASVVEIVDQLKNQTTWFVYNAGAAGGQQVARYQQNGVNASGYQSATLIGLSGTAGVAYAPAENQLYQWVDTATLTRPVTNESRDYGWVFSGVGANSPTYPYTRTTSLVSGVQDTNFREVVSATGSAHVNSFGTGNACCGTDFSGTWNQVIYDHLTLTLTNTVKASYPIGITFNGGGASTVNVSSNASIVLNGPINNLQGTTSVTTTGANSSITIAPGAINPLVSGTQVTLTAPGGIGALERPVPIQVYGGALTATSTDRDIAVAATGSLLINQVKVDTTHTNAITGKPEPLGSVFISATGDINSAAPFNTANPVVIGKSIEINSSGGAIGALSGVDGNGLSVLNSINPLVVQAWATKLANGTTDGGILNSSSSTGAYLVQSSGDLKLGAISSNGAVFLESVTGNILNGVAAGGLTAAQTAYLESVWTSLDLVNGSGGAAVGSYQSMINGAYNDYWQLRNLAFADPDTYSITQLGTRAIGAQLIAAGVLAAGTDLVAPTTGTRAAIQAAATKRYQQDQYLLGIKTVADLGVSLDTLFGTAAGQTSQFKAAVSNAALTTALATFDPNFAYVLPTNSTLYANLNSGSQWSLDQLRYTVSASANPANGVAPPSIANLPLNVSGRQVMLYAPNGSIGSLAPPESFSFTSNNASTLSGAQKALLASAGPGQLTVAATTDPNTGIVSYTVNIAQQSLVIVSPLGPIAAKASDQIYLGSASDMLLGGIANATFGPIVAARTAGLQTTKAIGGDVSLHAVGSILGGVAGQVAISGNIANLTLISETGSIGQAGAAGTDPATNGSALLLALSGATVGRLDQAVAQQGIYLRQTTGDLVLGNITSGQGSAPIQFGASGSIYAEPQFTDRTTVHIAGSTLDLRAGGNVGFNGGTLQPLQVKISGAITGVAGGNMTILSPSSDLTAGRAGPYGTLTSGGSLTLDTIAGTVFINSDVTSTNDLVLLANAAITIAAGTSADHMLVSSSAGAITIVSATLSMGAYSDFDAFGTINVTTTGNATLGQLRSAASFATANGPSITVAAGGVTTGAILSNGDGRTNLVTTGAGATVSLTASSIGALANRVSVDAPLLTAVATSGGIYLNAVSNLEATLLSAAKGNVDIVAGAALRLDSVIAGTAGTFAGTFTADVTGTLTIGAATSTGTQIAHAGQDIVFTTLTTTGIAGDAGDVLLTAGSIQGGSIAPAGLARLTATAGITGTGSIVTTELIELTAGGQINWATLNGKTVTVESTGGGATVGNATSRGTLKLLAKQDAGFTQLTTTGLAGDPSDVIVTTAEGTILGGSIASHGLVTLTAGANLPLNSPSAANAKIVSTGSITSSSLIALNARGQIDWETLNAPTTINVTSTDGGARVGTATAGGSITMRGKQDVAFDQLTNTGSASDITLTSDNGAIVGGSITSDGSVSLIAAGSITATGASGSGGALNWSMLRAGGSMFLRSLGDAITIDDASSGGSMTLWAKNNVTFRQLTATGAGSGITLRSDEGAIIALGTGLVNVDAGGSVTMMAATTITGSEVRAGGSVEMTATNGRIGWNAITAGTSVNVRSSADVIDIATITSGGTQTLWAEKNVTFTQLTATAGGADITSNTRAIIGGSVSLGGATRMAAKTTISGTTATSTAGSMDMSAEETITWNAVNAAGGSLTITSTRETMNIPSLASGGKMKLDVAQDMLITQITTTGIPNDAGDVDVTSHTGRITGGTIAANGGITLSAPVSITGVSATGATGAVFMNTNGLIDWATLNAGKQIDVRSTTGAVAFGTATSGGSQTIRAANDVNFVTLTTTGITGDLGNVDVTSDNTLIQGVTVAANGSATLTAATTNKGTGLTATNGSVGLYAGGLIDWATLNAGTQINVRSTAGAVALGTATSGGSQTIRAANDVNFVTLTTTGITGDLGNVDVTSDNTLIQGVTVAANGSATLTAATTNKGTGLTATNGLIGLYASGLIDWATLNAGKQIDVRSTTGAVAFGTATSGGSQTIRAANDVNFGTLTTTGITGDLGNVDVTSDNTLIQGTTVAANGSATLTAATTNKGTTLTTSTGSATLLAGGLIDWTNVNAAKSFTAISTGGAINLGTAISGGSQTLRARDDVTFTKLATTGTPGDQGNISATSDQGSIRGATVAANGDASFDGGVSIDLGTLRGGSVALSTPRDLTVNFLQVYRAMSLAADTINVTAEQLPSVPAVPLHVTVTGYRGGVATLANVTIDPPEVIVDRLSVTDIVLNVDSPKLTIGSGYVPGQMTLTTPAGDILLDNRSPAPAGGVNLQLYQPGGLFSMQQLGSANYANTYVVYYDNTISSTITNYGGGPYTGSSFVRDIPQEMRGGERFDFASVDKSGLAAFYLLGLPGGWRIDAARTPLPVEAIGDGPAVNIDGLPEAKKLHQPRDRKTLRNRIRSTSLEKGDGARLDFAAAAK